MFKLFKFSICTFLLLGSQAFAFSLSDLWIGEAASKRRQVKEQRADKFMISAAHRQATKAGFNILGQGGNAIDAAIAAQMVLNVVEPQSSGIGGGGFLIYFDAKSSSYKYFNGRESAPALAHDRMFLDENSQPKKFRQALQGGLSVATPGALKMLKEVHQQYGKLEWKKLFKPAIKLARNGFKVDDRLYVNLQRANYLQDFPKAAKMYFDEDGQPHKVGIIIKNEELAQTLETIADEGIKPFYEGKIAQNIVNKVKNSPKNPGFLRVSDLKNYQVKQGDLVCANYRKKYKICSMPPPSSGGITILQILGILENFDLSKLKPNSAPAVHLIAEATRLAYEDRNKYIGDSSQVPIKKMLDKKYLKSRSSLIDVNKASTEFNPGDFANINNNNVLASYKQPEPPETTHMSIIDKEGNAIAFTSSIEYFFGSALMVDGFLLNNHMTDFSFIPEIDGKKVANRVEPFKQPRSSMSPTFIFDENDKLMMVVGSPGGPRIIQYVTKTIIYYLDWNYGIQESISAPNFTVLNNVIELEKGTKIVELVDRLEQIGHQVKIKDQVSGLHAIIIDQENGIIAGADPRRSGVAMGR